MKIRNLFYLPLVVLLLFTSCEKYITPLNTIKEENNIDLNLESGEVIGNGGNGTSCESNIGVVCNGMLEFRDLQHFFDVYECLNISYENYNDSFESLYSSLNDSLYNELCDSLNFNEDLPLINFESNFAYVSYRRHFSNLEDQWLDNSTLDPNADPEANNPFTDEVFMTLFNENRAVKIGTSIYWVSNDGTTYEITNGSCELLADLIRDPKITDPNIIMFGNSTVGDCIDKGRSGQLNYYDNNKKCYKSVVKFNSGFFGTKVLSKIKSYKKRNSGKWKKYRTNLELNVSGVTYDTYCENPVDFYKAKGPKRRRKLKCAIFRGNASLMYKPNTISGGFYCNGNTLYLPL